MYCPYCGYTESRVIDSREIDDAIRRRRQCERCERRFTTYERVHRAGLLIVKKDGRREEYNREKLLSGIQRACQKRPLDSGDIEAVVDDIEAALHGLGRAEVPSHVVGDMVMERLKALDHIAYIRFASVYRAFRDVEDLKEELAALERGRTPTTASQQLPLLPAEALEGAPRSPRRSRGRLRAVPARAATPAAPAKPAAASNKRARGAR